MTATSDFTKAQRNRGSNCQPTDAQPVILVLKRTYEGTVAIVSALDAHYSHAPFRERLENAVTRWAESEIANGNVNLPEDFNIADLALVLGSPRLTAEIEREGILGLDIYVLTEASSEDWCFDSHLIRKSVFAN
jgi:hypothetical protein